MRITRVVAVVCAVAASVVVSAQDVRRDGRWEVTMEMEMEGMKMPSMKSTQCVTKEQAGDSNQLPGQQDKDKNCTVGDFKMTGNKTTWTMKCTGKDAMTGSGEITYTADSYDGAMKMKSKDGDMTMKYKGKRLGDCTK